MLPAPSGSTSTPRTGSYIAHPHFLLSIKILHFRFSGIIQSVNLHTFTLYFSAPDNDVSYPKEGCIQPALHVENLASETRPSLAVVLKGMAAWPEIPEYQCPLPGAPRFCSADGCSSCWRLPAVPPLPDTTAHRRHKPSTLRFHPLCWSPDNPLTSVPLLPPASRPVSTLIPHLPAHPAPH